MMKTFSNITQISVVGLGGVGSYLLPALLKTIENTVPIILIDGDSLEEANLNRQLFSQANIGMNKAEALKRTYRLANIKAIPEYIDDDFFVLPNSLTFSCVDNNPAKLAMLNAVDNQKATLIVGGNEYISSQAYYYISRFKNTKADPRIRFPSMLTDLTGHRIRPSCDEEQKDNRQLAIYNQIAASYMLHLFWFYHVERLQLRKKTQSHFPIQHSCNFSLHHTTKLGELNESS